jgi:hypothetical protein
MLNLLADESLPEGMSDILILPLMLTLIGFLLFYAGAYVEAKRGKAVWKWIGVLPIAVSLVIGFQYLYRWLSDSVYAEAVSTGAAKKMVAAHWGAFIIPLIGLGAVALVHFYGDKLNLTPSE